MKTKRQPNKQQPTSTSPRRFYRNFLTQARCGTRDRLGGNFFDKINRIGRIGGERGRKSGELVDGFVVDEGVDVVEGL